ncbi:hypothetical protein [Flagellimonas flava]|uniref:Uncharacterized protein n=1 Tax=Flagellimonas flava TaxID=570519 RepID=A0A1M5HK88_9FLAO|nr:hypothetical protein [Allomuricauda flava]SHG16376.1 hypothetical protein SAMN04488116_0029 [Allomuricauda flava]
MKTGKSERVKTGVKKSELRLGYSRNIPRMIPWKQALVTAAGVYPLLLTYEWLVKQILPLHHIDRRITLLIVVLMISISMVFMVMPFMLKILGPWLFKNKINK